MDEQAQGETTPQLPAWQWEPKELALRPRCPVCDGRLIASGRRFTCLIVGHRHYDEPIEEVIASVFDLLGRPEP